MFFLGAGQIWILSILVVSIWMFFGIMTNPKNDISCIWNLHFSVLIFKFFRFNMSKTILTYLTCSFLVSEYTKMSFIYIIANLFKYDYNILLTIFCIVVGVFVNPNGMTKYSYILYFVLNAVFNKIRIVGKKWKTFFRTRYGFFELLIMNFGLCGTPFISRLYQ